MVLTSTSDEDELWHFVPGQPTTEEIFELIGQAITQELQRQSRQKTLIEAS